MGINRNPSRLQGPRPRSNLRPSGETHIPKETEPVRFGMYRPVTAYHRDTLAMAAVEAVAEVFPDLHTQRVLYMDALEDLMAQMEESGDDDDVESLEAVSYARRYIVPDKPDDEVGLVFDDATDGCNRKDVVTWQALQQQFGDRLFDYPLVRIFYRWQKQLPYLSRFVINTEMGATFASREKTACAFKNGVEASHVLGKKIDAVAERLWSPNEEAIAVLLDLDNVFWGGVEKRKLIIGLDTSSEAYEQLREEAAFMNSLFGEYSDRLRGLFGVPDHVTVGHYGVPRDGRGLNRAIEKRAVVSCLQKKLGENAVFACHLLPVNIGTTYSEPTPHWAEAVNRQATLKTY